MQISCVVIPESNLDQYLDYVRRSDIPAFEAAHGLASILLLQRRSVAHVEVMTTSNVAARRGTQAIR
jgi:hypothetical protein